MDLAIASLVLVSLMSLAFFAGLKASRPERFWIPFSAAALIFFVGLIVAPLDSKVWVVDLIPFSGIIVVEFCAFIPMCFMSGMAWGSTRTAKTMSLGSLLVMLFAMLWVLCPGLFGRIPSCGVTSPSTCIQTTDASCAPTCAAALMRLNGIGTTEREMVDLCLTSNSGTYNLGLYRGLKRKASQAGLDVRVVKSFPPKGPAVLSFSDWKEPSPGEKKLGIIGTSHAVLFLDSCPSGYRIADPYTGKIDLWTHEEVGATINGEFYGFEIVPMRGER
jgi:hypothetical protein